MPAFLPLSEVPGGLLLDEGETVVLANRALVPLGVPALDRLAPLSTGEGTTIFAYLTPDQVAEPGMAAVLATLELPMQLVVPGLPAEQAAALAVLAGVPMLALPQHNEQANKARGAAATGAHQMLLPGARGPQALAAAIREMWGDDALARRARDLAAALRPAFPDDAPTVIARALARF